MRPLKILATYLATIYTLLAPLGLIVQVVLLILKAIQAAGIFKLAWLAPILSVQFWIPAIIVLIELLIIFILGLISK